MAPPEDRTTIVLENVAGYLSAKRSRLELAFRELEVARHGDAVVSGRRLDVVCELVREALEEDRGLWEYVVSERRELQKRNAARRRRLSPEADLWSKNKRAE